MPKQMIANPLCPVYVDSKRRSNVSNAQIADIRVEPRSGRSLPVIRATAVARARSDPERRHGLGMLKRRAGRVDANLTGR
jgi:hypothetical protein